MAAESAPSADDEAPGLQALSEPAEQVALAPEIVKRPRSTASDADAVPGQADPALPTVDVREKREPLFDMRAWRDMPAPGEEAPKSPLMRMILERHPWLAPKDPAAAKPVQIKGKRRGFVTDYKFLGIQFEDGGRITIRRKNGVPTLMYRRKF